MISEISFSRGYSSFWSEHAPWINEYVNSINQGFIERLQNPIEIGDDSKHRSINNVMAFTLFKNIITKVSDNFEIALEESINIVKNYPRNNLESYKLTDDYKKIINNLVTRLVKRYENKNLTFYPQFAGCGIMDNCQGDIYYNEILAEIKAGERNLVVSDIKQIITYCALNWLSTNRINITNIEFYNPRQGILWESNLSDLFYSISSIPMEDFFDQIGKYLSNLSEDIEF